MRLRCRIADDAPADLISIAIPIEVEGRRIGIPFARETGVRERKGPGCVVDIGGLEVEVLMRAIAAREDAACFIVEPIEIAPTGPIVRLTMPGEYQDRDIVEVPFIADAPGASEAEMREADRRIERKLPALVRQVAVACGGVRHLPPFRTAEERAAVARRAPPPGVEHPLVGRARVLEEAARQIREKAAAELQAAAIARAEAEAAKHGEGAPSATVIGRALNGAASDRAGT